MMNATATANANATMLEDLERRDFARHLVARQMYASDAVRTLIARYSINEADAFRLYHSARGEVAAASAAKEPADFVREALDFWRSVLSDAEQSLSVKMTAQREIVELTTDRKAKKRKQSITASAEAAEREAREALQRLDAMEREALP